MKVRKGFVSNSSSSSFIISVPSGTELTPDAFHKALYGNTNSFQVEPTWSFGDQEGVESYQAIQAILEQIDNYKQDDTSKAKLLTDNVVVVDLDYEQFRLSDGKYDWDTYQAEYDVVKEAEVKRLIEIMKDKDLYVVSFSDNDGPFNSEMEHGAAINGVPGIIRYSHH